MAEPGCRVPCTNRTPAIRRLRQSPRHHSPTIRSQNDRDKQDQALRREVSGSDEQAPEQREDDEHQRQINLVAAPRAFRAERRCADSPGGPVRRRRSASRSPRRAGSYQVRCGQARGLGWIEEAGRRPATPSRRADIHSAGGDRHPRQRDAVRQPKRNGIHASGTEYSCHSSFALRSTVRAKGPSTTNSRSAATSGYRGREHAADPAEKEVEHLLHRQRPEDVPTPGR